MEPTFESTNGTVYVRPAVIVALTDMIASGRELLPGDVVIPRGAEYVRPGARTLVDDTTRNGWVRLVDQVWSGGCWDDVPESARNVRASAIGCVRRASTHDANIPDFLSPRWDPR